MSLLGSEANSESCQTSNMELFAKIAKNKKPFTIFVKTSILNVWKGSEYAYELSSKVKDVSFLNNLNINGNKQITYQENPKRKSQPNFKIAEWKCC